MAQIMGIGVGTLRMIESGHLPKRLSACVIVKLMVYFNLKAGALFAVE